MTADSSQNGSEARGVATYVLNEPASGDGIRSFPYSTDMLINPLTYASLPSASIPYGVGEILCSILWDMYWAFVEDYGFDSDLYRGTGGNNMAMQLVIDGLKLQVCNPGFVEVRDALLLADQINYDGANQCLIWSVFARRGVGFSADQGLATSITDGSEAFDIPESCVRRLLVSKRVNKSEVQAGDTLTYTIQLTNEKKELIPSVLVIDTLPQYVTFLPNSSNCGVTEAIGILFFQIGSLGAEQSLSCTFQVVVDEVNGNTQYSLFDDVEGPQAVFGTSSLVGSANWRVDSMNPNTGSQAYFVPNQEGINDQLLLSPLIDVDSSTHLYFWHSYATEPAKDGGFLEIFDPSQGGWIDLGPYIIKNGYNNISAAIRLWEPEVYSVGKAMLTYRQ